MDGAIGRNVKVGNPQFIFIERNARILEYSWLYAITGGGHDEYSPRIEIHKGCLIGRFCQITCSNRLVFEKDVFLSEGILVTDTLHGYYETDVPVIRQKIVSLGPVVVGEGAWIGSGARIVGKVTIGRNAVVAANAVVVNKYVPPYTMVAGVPARIVKRYDPERNDWVKTLQKLENS